MPLHTSTELDDVEFPAVRCAGPRSPANHERTLAQETRGSWPRITNAESCDSVALVCSGGSARFRHPGGVPEAG